MMLKVIEDAEKEAFLKNSKEKAAKINAVDARANLTFPKQILYLFSEQGKEATLQRITCIHMFESAP